MQKWVLLLRGINVGGKNIVPMKSLCELLARIGCENVKTYIQSGNVVLQHSEEKAQVLSDAIATNVQHTFGFKPHVLLLTYEQFKQVILNNPFPNAEAEPKTLHVFFLSSQATSADLATISSLKASSESYELHDQAFYLHAPDGIGRSKLVARVEKLLGVPTTARNWNTVSKLQALLESR